MATQVQWRRGTHTQVSSFTGALGEVVVDTTQNRLVLQDGTTVGGWPQATSADLVALQASITAVIVAIQSGTYTWATVGGTSDALALTTTPALASLVPGTVVAFIATSTNTTTTPTAALDGLAAKVIRRNNIALNAGDIVSGEEFILIYDGTYWQIMGGNYAPLVSPAFSGSPTVPTPANPTDSSTLIPNTAWVGNFVAAVTNPVPQYLLQNAGIR